MLQQLQLSNYDTKGIFVLEADSGYQMVINRVREMIKLDPDLHVDIIGPNLDQLRTSPRFISGDVFASSRVHYVPIRIIPNALATRYDFAFEAISDALALTSHQKNPDLRYDIVFLNDPMLLRHYKALFFLKAGYKPKYIVHSHFIDNVENPKFPPEASLWLGQCEAAIQADFNFWQCESAMKVFFNSMSLWFNEEIVESVKKKSLPWDDGYSVEEITQKPDMNNVRINIEEFERSVAGKKIIFVPNRIGGQGRSSDYTNCGKFMFEVLPKLRERRDDYVVIAGNPSQKFLNHELEQICGKDGYINLVPDAFNRDEYRYVAARSHLAVGLYDQDSYGGTAARECIELGCLPIWVDCYEYSSIAREASTDGWSYQYMCRPDFKDIVDVTDNALEACSNEEARIAAVNSFRRVIRPRCSFEYSTPVIMKKMKEIVK
jgi:hypothetical protein